MKNTTLLISIIIVLALLAGCAPAPATMPTATATPLPTTTTTPVPTSTSTPNPTETKTTTPTATATAVQIQTGLPESATEIQVYPEWTNVADYNKFLNEKILPAARAMNIDPATIYQMGFSSNAGPGETTPYDVWDFIPGTLDPQQIIVGYISNIEADLVTFPVKYGEDGEVKFWSVVIPRQTDTGQKSAVDLLAVEGLGEKNMPLDIYVYMDANMPSGSDFRPENLQGRQWIQDLVEQPVGTIPRFNPDGTPRSVDPKYDIFSRLITIIKNSRGTNMSDAQIDVAMNMLEKLVLPGYSIGFAFR